MAFLELLVVLLQAVLRIVEHQGLHTHTPYTSHKTKLTTNEHEN